MGLTPRTYSLLLLVLLSAAIVVGGVIVSGQEYEVKNALYLGYVDVDADTVPGFLLISKNASGGYYEALVSGIEYSPEPNTFDIALVKLVYTNGRGDVVKVYEYDQLVDNGFSPSTNILPGTRLGSNWTAIVAADNRPYGEPPWKTINVYGVILADGKISVSRIISLPYNKPVYALQIYPGPGKDELILLYRQLDEYEDSKHWVSTYGVTIANLQDKNVIRNIEFPVKLVREGSTITLQFADENKTVKVNRFYIAFLPRYNDPSRSRGTLYVTYMAGTKTYLNVYDVDFSTGSIVLAATESFNGYDIVLSNTGANNNFTKYWYSIALIDTTTSSIRVIVYDYSSDKGLVKVFDNTVTSIFDRVYLVVQDNNPFLVIQKDSILYLNDLKGNNVKLFKYSGRYGARTSSINNDVVLMIIEPGVKARLYFTLLNPPASTETTIPSTTSIETTTTQTTTTKTSTIKTNTTSPTKTMSQTNTTPTSTVQQAPSTSFILGKGDWLEYKVVIHGRGPLGEMNVEARVKAYVDRVGGGQLVFRIEPLTSLSEEEKSLLAIASMTGNKIFLSLASGVEVEDTYTLPPGRASQSCPLLVDPATGREYQYSDEALGHKYSITCRYTSKGILEEMTFTDTYSAGGQSLDIESTVKLVGSNRDVGLEQATGTGLSLANPLIIGVIAVVIVVVIIAVVVVLKKR